MNEAGLPHTLSVVSRVLLAGVVFVSLCGALGCGSSSGVSSGGGGGGGTTGGTPLTAGGAKDIYVMQLDSSGLAQSILDFAADTSGSLMPKATLLPPPGMAMLSIATDSIGQLYVGVEEEVTSGNPAYEVLVYAPGSTGQATPVRTINLIGGPGEFYLPLDMAVDSMGKLYVVGLGIVGTFPANATGDTAAITSFPFPEVDGGSGPTGIAVDGLGNIYLGNYLPNVTATSETGNIFIFAAGANGNVSPTNTIYTQGVPYGIAVDASGNIYSAVDNTTLNSSGVVTASTCVMTEFGSIASGSLAEVKTISGAATGFSLCAEPNIDEAGNLYLVNEVISGTGASPTVVGFAPTATGNVEPGIMFSSSSWTESGLSIALH